jgi:translation initiation factor 2 subunit 1
MVSSTTDRQGAIDLLEKACEVIGERIREEEGGSLNVRMRPKAVSETDDAELQALMDRYIGLRVPPLVVFVLMTYPID